jgi:hypothetical protein
MEGFPRTDNPLRLSGLGHTISANADNRKVLSVRGVLNEI